MWHMVMLPGSERMFTPWDHKVSMPDEAKEVGAAGLVVGGDRRSGPPWLPCDA